MAHRKQERGRHAGGGPWADVELGSASVSAPCGGWGFRDVSSVCRCAFCSARWAVPGAGLTSFRGGAARRRLWRPGPSAEIGARRVFPQTAAVGDFLALFFVAAAAFLPGGGFSIWGRWWLWWHLGGFWSHMPRGGRVWLAGGGVSYLFHVFPARRLNGRGAWAAPRADWLLRYRCCVCCRVGYLDGLPHGLGLWCW